MILTARNPRWEDAEKTVIGLTIETEEGEIIDFVTSQNNSVPEERMLYNFAVRGMLGEIQEYKNELND